ncbi:MAG: hypothetical protein NTW87_17135, partial [Planctomycetota bacterium]|nr:hypothetical protein [Planctomycetota bacterium]
VGLLRARAARAIGDLRAQAEAKLKAVMDEVGKCLADKRWADGKKALDAANAVEYRAWNPRLEDLRGKVAAGEQAEAEAARSAIVAAAETAFARYVNAFVSTTLKGDVKGARKIAVEAKADASLKEVAAKSQELSAVCDALEKADAARAAAFETLKDGKERSFETVKGPMKGVVSRVTADEIYVAFKMGGAAGEQPIKLSELTPAERKRLAGDFKPQDPAEHLALAIRALAADDTPSAAAALAAAKDHPLAPPYQAKLDEKQLGAVEAAAKSAWDAIMRAAGTGKLSEKAAKDIGDRVEAFEKDHGKTKRAASIAGEMAALKERLLTAGGGWKAIPPENVRVALKGQATSAVENGALALTAPAGQGNSAVVSLLNFARDFRLRFEFSGDALHMALRGEQFDPGRRVNWQGCIQVFISPDDYNVRIQPVGDAQQPPPWQVLRREARPGLLARGWHTIEISAAARLLTVAFDGVPLCREEHLAAVARGDAFLMVFPAREGRKCAIRNIMIAQLDKETTAGTFEGLLMDNLQGNPFITFKADHEDVSRRYAVPQLPGGGPDLSVLEPLKKVVSLNRLKLSWKLQPDGQPAIVGVQVDRPAANSGVLVGTITFLQGGCVEVLPENGLSERFIPVWRPGPPDRSLMQAVGKSKVGDKVKVTWTYDDRKRMIAIEAAP